MKLQNWILSLLAASLIFSCSQSKKDESGEDEEQDTVSTETQKPADTETSGVNTLTEAEKADGWMLLFDGENTDNWRGYQKENFPAAWNIEKDALHIQGSGRGEAGAKDGGDIIYDKKFGDFHLKLEWMVDSAANAGIFYRGQELDEYDFIWKTAPEMQVLDNKNHPDAQKGKNGNRQAGSLYDLIPADPQNFKGHGTWNSAEVIARGNDIVHIQNGDTVVQYTIGSDRMNKLIADSKWPGINENWGSIAMEGYIGLQDHGDDVWFRNVKIKELD